MATGYEAKAYRDLATLADAADRQADATERLATALENALPHLKRLADAADLRVLG